MKSTISGAVFAASSPVPFADGAVDVEGSYRWTSSGEAAAVAEFARAFDSTGNKWVDAAIAGADPLPDRS